MHFGFRRHCQESQGRETKKYYFGRFLHLQIFWNFWEFGSRFYDELFIGLQNRRIQRRDYGWLGCQYSKRYDGYWAFWKRHWQESSNRKTKPTKKTYNSSICSIKRSEKCFPKQEKILWKDSGVYITENVTALRMEDFNKTLKEHGIRTTDGKIPFKLNVRTKEKLFYG